MFGRVFRRFKKSSQWVEVDFLPDEFQDVNFLAPSSIVQSGDEVSYSFKTIRYCAGKACSKAIGVYQIDIKQRVGQIVNVTCYNDRGRVVERSDNQPIYELGEDSTTDRGLKTIEMLSPLLPSNSHPLLKRLACWLVGLPRWMEFDSIPSEFQDVFSIEKNSILKSDSEILFDFRTIRYRGKARDRTIEGQYWLDGDAQTCRVVHATCYDARGKVMTTTKDEPVMAIGQGSMVQMGLEFVKALSENCRS